MGTNCAPLVADLFLFCYEKDFMLPPSEDNQSGVIEAFNSQMPRPYFWIYIYLYRMVL